MAPPDLSGFVYGKYILPCPAGVTFAGIVEKVGLKIGIDTNKLVNLLF